MWTDSVECGGDSIQSIASHPPKSPMRNAIDLGECGEESCAVGKRSTVASAFCPLHENHYLDQGTRRW